MATPLTINLSIGKRLESARTVTPEAHLTRGNDGPGAIIPTGMLTIRRRRHRMTGWMGMVIAKHFAPARPGGTMGSDKRGRIDLET